MHQQPGARRFHLSPPFLVLCVAAALVWPCASWTESVAAAPQMTSSLRLQVLELDVELSHPEVQWDAKVVRRDDGGSFDLVRRIRPTPPFLSIAFSTVRNDMGCELFMVKTSVEAGQLTRRAAFLPPDWNGSVLLKSSKQWTACREVLGGLLVAAIFGMDQAKPEDLPTLTPALRAVGIAAVRKFGRRRSEPVTPATAERQTLSLEVSGLAVEVPNIEWTTWKTDVGGYESLGIRYKWDQLSRSPSGKWEALTPGLYFTVKVDRSQMSCKESIERFATRVAKKPPTAFSFLPPDWYPLGVQEATDRWEFCRDLPAGRLETSLIIGGTAAPADLETVTLVLESLGSAASKKVAAE